MRAVAAAAVPMALVGGLAMRNGGYDPPTWGWATLALLPILVVAAVSAPRPTRGGLVLLAALGGLLLWAAASLAWSIHVEATVLELERTLLYLVAAATLLAIVRPGTGAFALAGVAAASAGICAWVVTERLLARDAPLTELVADPVAARKLAGPVGYSNALALLAVVGLLLCVGFALRSRAGGARLAAGAALPILAATLYLTLGRGAWVALGVGLGAAVALDVRRLELAAGVVVLAIVPALAILAAARSGAERPLADAAEGRPLMTALLSFAAASAAVAWLVPPILARARLRTPPRRLVVGAAAALALGVVAAAAVAAVAADDAVDAFERPSAGGEARPSERLLSLSGSGRAEYWRVALENARDHPALGSGAGSWGRVWLERREDPLPARDAHNLYLESLSELGPVGLALVLLLIAGAGLAALRARGAPIASCAAGAAAAYAVHAASEWHWEMPVATVALLSLIAGLLALRSDDRPRLPRRALIAAVAALVAPLAAAALAGNRALQTAEAALDGPDYRRAASEAERARRWSPWAAEPLRVAGEARLAQGDVAAARRMFRQGLAEDERNWELWLDLAQASGGASASQARERAERLNPLGPELRG